MKLIKIGSIDIVVSHITHFEYEPEQHFNHPASESPMPVGYSPVRTDIPAKLTVWIDAGSQLHFRGAEAEEGYTKLKEIFS